LLGKAGKGDAVKPSKNLTVARDTKVSWSALDSRQIADVQGLTLPQLCQNNMPVRGRSNYNNRKPRIDYLKFENRFDLLKKKEKPVS